MVIVIHKEGGGEDRPSGPCWPKKVLWTLSSEGCETVTW